MQLCAFQHRYCSKLFYISVAQMNITKCGLTMRTFVLHYFVMYSIMLTNCRYKSAKITPSSISKVSRAQISVLQDHAIALYKCDFHGQTSYLRYVLRSGSRCLPKICNYIVICVIVVLRQRRHADNIATTSQFWCWQDRYQRGLLFLAWLWRFVARISIQCCRS